MSNILDARLPRSRATSSSSPTQSLLKGDTKYEFPDNISDGLVESYDFDDYKMKPGNKRVAVILNFREFKARGLKKPPQSREGSEEDVKRLKYSLENHLGFDVKAFEDATRRKVFEEVNNLIHDDHSSTDCVMVVIMTHGDGEGLLEANDEDFKLKNVLNLFKHNNNRTLSGKPKLFFIQACRGDSLNKGEKLECFDAKGNGKEELLIPTGVDQLVMYATGEGSSAIRNPETGSWLIQELCEQIENNRDEDFLSMLTIVVRKVALRRAIIHDTETAQFKTVKQGAVIVSSLTKKIFFVASNERKEKALTSRLQIANKAADETDEVEPAASFLEQQVNIKNWQLITSVCFVAFAVFASTRK